MAEWKLSSEICSMYTSSYDVPNVIKFIIVMKDDDIFSLGTYLC